MAFIILNKKLKRNKLWLNSVFITLQMKVYLLVYPIGLFFDHNPGWPKTFGYINNTGYICNQPKDGLNITYVNLILVTFVKIR